MMSAPNGDGMRLVSELLLDEAASIAPDGRWLILGGEAALARGLTEIATDVTWVPTDSRERENADGDVVVRDTVPGGAYDRVLLPIPPDRDLSRRWLLTAWDALRPGGLLLLVGANAEGAKSILADAARTFGHAVAGSYRQKHRIARFRRADHLPEARPPWSGTDGVLPGTWQQFDVTIAGEPVTLETQPGVFAGNRLDTGSSLLLVHLQVDAGSRVLDVGCGAGVIGVAAHRNGASLVDMVDTNLLAVQAAGRNADRLGIPGRVLAGDVYDAVSGDRYDLIVSNPPFHRGKEIDLSVADRLIAEAPHHLLPGGRILIVANAFLAYGKQMQRVFRHVETVAASRQYHVLEGRNPQ